MYHCPAVCLLEAIRNDAGVEVTINHVRQEDGRWAWQAAARSPEGQLFRSVHQDQLFAVVLLERLLSKMGFRD